METLVKPKSAKAAMEIARQAADRLRAQGATRIVLFGSLARGTYVPGESDIDIYFEGIAERGAAVQALRLCYRCFSRLQIQVGVRGSFQE